MNAIEVFRYALNVESLGFGKPAKPYCAIVSRKTYAELIACGKEYAACNPMKKVRRRKDAPRLVICDIPIFCAQSEGFEGHEITFGYAKDPCE